MTHANAPFTPEGRRRLAMLIVDEGWTVRRAAERFQCSPATASRWARRYRAGQSLTDRSSRPQRSPHRTSRRTERRIIALRCTRRWGPHRISYHLGIPRSTIERVLARYRMPLRSSRGEWCSKVARLTVSSATACLMIVGLSKDRRRRRHDGRGPQDDRC
jgi:transposase